MAGRAKILIAAATLTAAGCGSSGDGEALQDELDAAIVERDALAARVEELEAQLTGSLPVPGSSEDEATGPNGESSGAAEPSATPEPPPDEPAERGPVEPAALDASPYVVGFGDLSVVSLADGEPGVVTVIVASDTIDRSGSVPIIVRNNTSDAVGNIEIAGTARDDSGALVGSGSSQGLKPVIVAPGEIAYGYVYFDTEMAGSTFDYQFSIDAQPAGEYFFPVTITEINTTGDQIIGAVTNQNDFEVTGPIGADGICFGPDGAIVDTIGSYLEQDDLPAGGVGSFSIDLYGEPCPIGLVSASGYG